MAAFAELDLSARTEQLERAVGEIRNIGNEGERTEQRVKKSTNAMNMGFQSLIKFAGGMVTAFVSMRTAMSSIAMARDFNASLAETSTLLSGNVDEMQRVEEGARALARQFGGTATAQVQGYYQAISAGAGNAAEATRILEQANRLAVGGVTDVTTGVDVLTTAVNAYRASGLTAAEASDALFTGMRAGKTTVDELSASVGQVLPVATSLGVTFDETVAAMSALTTQGIGTAQAATGVRAALTSMIRPTKQSADLAKELGINFSAAGVEALGFGGMMDQIIEKTGGSTEQIQMLFGSIEATTAALSFAGGAGEVFNDIMGDMANKAGATGEAFDLVADSLDQRLVRVLSRGSDMLLGLGNALLAVVVPAAEGAIVAIDFLGDNLEFLGVASVALASTQIPAVVAALAAKTAGMTAAGIAAGVLTGAMRALGIAMAVAGGPLGLLLGIVGGLTGAMILFRDTTETAVPIMDDAKDAVDRINSVLATSSEVALPAAARETLNLTNENIKLAKSAYAAAEAELAKADAFMKSRTVRGGAAGAMAGVMDPSGRSESIQGLAAARERLAAAEANLTDRINDGQLALTGAGEAMSEYQRRAIDLTVTMDDLAASVGGGGGSGAGADDGFAGRLDALTQQFMSERELVDQWYEEAQEILADRRADEILGEEGHRQALLQVEELYQQQLAAIRAQAHQQTLSEAATFFGAMASVTQQGGERLNRVTRTLGAVQALINTFVAQSQVLADPALGFFGKMAAYATIGAAGLGLVASLRSGGGSGGGRSAGRGSTTSTREATQAPEQSRQRVLRFDVQGDGMFADMLRQNVDAIASAIIDEQRLGGTTILVGRA